LAFRINWTSLSNVNIFPKETEYAVPDYHMVPGGHHPPLCRRWRIQEMAGNFLAMEMVVPVPPRMVPGMTTDNCISINNYQL
jgi:hypothetical protein